MPTKNLLLKVLNRAGLELRRAQRFGPLTASTIEAVKPYTMTSPDRLAALCDAIRYIHRWSIPGAIVECGVWAGGSAMAAARTLIEVGDTDRDVYLFDTFEGMPEPTEIDRDVRGVSAADQLRKTSRTENLVWCYASLADVQKNLAGTNYPPARCHYVKGRVEDTIPAQAPTQIALLRLDTDWYESTRHELTHLCGRLAPNAVLIIDDYGHWQGARKAVDEWMEIFDRPVFLNRIDSSGRIAVIPATRQLSAS